MIYVKGDYIIIFIKFISNTNDLEYMYIYESYHWEDGKKKWKKKCFSFPCMLDRNDRKIKE